MIGILFAGLNVLGRRAPPVDSEPRRDCGWLSCVPALTDTPSGMTRITEYKLMASFSENTEAG